MSNHTIQQHLIDPEICIRCNTCEATCPVGAISHDDRNYVVDASKCNLCMACVPPCPTGSIDNWRTVVKASAYSTAAQLTWDELPAELPAEALQSAAAGVKTANSEQNDQVVSAFIESVATKIEVSDTASPPAPALHNHSATIPPWSAAHPYTGLYGPKSPITATVTGNVRVTELAKDGRGDYDTHHIVLDFGGHTMPLLEGQSIGIVAPGLDARGKPHHARQYSIASARDGERPGYNNASLTVKRVLEDHNGKAVRGVASNFLCDANVGDTVQVIGPFGHSFLMPNHPGSHIVMICTGTGSAPMRAMTEQRRRLAASAAQGAGKANTGLLLLFFGARSKEELPYFGPLAKLPADFISIHLAYSRQAGQAKVHVQDLLRQQAKQLAPLLADTNTHFYVCGLKAMEIGVLQALQDIATDAGLDWLAVSAELKSSGRMHLETY